MTDWIKERETALRSFFELPDETELLLPDASPPQLTPEQERHLQHYNLEWHVVPSAQALPMDEAYLDKMYPTRSRELFEELHHTPGFKSRLREGHLHQQGRIVAVETTVKPGYRPNNVQHYGTSYGFETTTDPFAPYMGRARFHTGTRYDHNYASLREMILLINQDWRAHGLMPEGYRLSICPPGLWNLIGNVFHPEWSETEALEMGFYRDDHENAHCYALGSNQPGDFSYIRAIEVGSSWTLLGFRTALLPGPDPHN